MRDDYWQGISDPEKSPDDLVECVVLTLGGFLCAFETGYAVEVIRPPRLAIVPGAGENSLVQGAFSLRGEIILAMDIRPLLDLPVTPFEKSSRIILVKSPSFKTGIIAESVLEVTDLSYSSFSTVPSNGNSGNERYLRGVLFSNNEEIRLLDMEALLASPEIIVNLSSVTENNMPEME
jgi:purine-binding chemotaxis protein CheW